MKKKDGFSWIKYPENIPESSKIFVVVSYENSENLYLDKYSNPKTKRILQKNDQKKIQWAVWKYKEECEDVTETQIIYKKIWNFFDDQGLIIRGVTHYLELPKYPGELNETK